MTMYKKRRRRSDTGVDDWLMTYADMITLLLCFFAIFLSISVPKAEQMKAAREKVLEQFASKDMQKDALIVLPFEAKEIQQRQGLNDRLPSIIDRYRNDQQGTTGYGQKPEPIQHVRESIDKTTGDRIVTLEMPSAAFFTSGSAVLSEDGQELLLRVIKDTLTVPEFQGYQVTVEGHTDDNPIKTLQFPSNWELSTARAASVVRFFIDNGIPASRLRVAGYSDAQPKVPNRDMFGKPIPDNQAQNRRVVIKLEKIEKKN